MNVLVTGGAGFIGSHLVDALVKKYKVVVIDNLSSGKKANLNSQAIFLKSDIQDHQLNKIFAKYKFNYVFHLAAQKDVRMSVKDPLFDARVNILGSLNLLENCCRFRVKKFIFASTGGAIYGETKDIPTRETHWPQPLSPYGIAKLTVEYYLNYYHLIHHLNYISLRLANIYGPRQDPYGEAGVVAIFFQKILSGKQPIINGSGQQTRDYTYVADTVTAFLRAIDKRALGIYNVGTGVETSVNKLFRKIVKITGKKVKEIHGPAKAGEQMRSAVDCLQIKRELNWQAKYTLEKGLKETMKFYAT